MVQVTFRRFDGDSAVTVEATLGQSLMAAAKQHRVEGIEAICGGAMACGTCHVYVDEAWYDRLPPPSDTERDVLEFSAEPMATSRLSCQLIVTSELDGLSVTTPQSQL